ncbi:C39 family peptidase [Paucilactobacillus nenjiangensis]|uniref:C39 family peptidase n=1 Tax=Paucilactobacillus nenjiangensis TaxID=1296540 RepID=UPI001CDB62EA|nr:C39 family peptidase [Paucilactobacillus nenjiangensis]
MGKKILLTASMAVLASIGLTSSVFADSNITGESGNSIVPTSTSESGVDSGSIKIQEIQASSSSSNSLSEQNDSNSEKATSQDTKSSNADSTNIDAKNVITSVAATPKNGVVEENASYYYQVDGVNQTNYFYSENNNVYYFGNDGKRFENQYYTNWGNTYYFGTGGARYSNQFLSQNSNVYYFDASGVRYNDKFYSNWGNVYYFGNGGARYTNQFYTNWGNVYYFGSDGVRYTNQFYSNWGNTYYFGGDGARYTNQFYQNWRHNYFFGDDGSLQKGFFNDGRTKFLADGNGVIYAAANDDTVALSQLPNLPTGCEIVAITMLLQYAGVNVSKEQIANEIPHSSNPNSGFVGNPYATASAWVLASGIASELSKYLGTSQLMNGASMFDIQTKLNQGHLVAVWMGDMNGFSEHCVTLTGYGADYLQYNNPWTGQKETMSYGTFYSRWGKIWNNALSF